MYYDIYDLIGLGGNLKLTFLIVQTKDDHQVLNLNYNFSTSSTLIGIDI
jgi:hypothetical protein